MEMIELYIVVITVVFIIALAARKPKNKNNRLRQQAAPGRPKTAPNRRQHSAPLNTGTKGTSGKAAPANVQSPGRQPQSATQTQTYSPVSSSPSAFSGSSASQQPDASLIGEHYEEWYPLPNGKKVVICTYCGASNLIPENGRPGHFFCYFCREELP